MLKTLFILLQVVVLQVIECYVHKKSEENKPKEMLLEYTELCQEYFASYLEGNRGFQTMEWLNEWIEKIYKRSVKEMGILRRKCKKMMEEYVWRRNVRRERTNDRRRVNYLIYAKVKSTNLKEWNISCEVELVKDGAVCK
jgi:hypothetical protein